MLARLFLIYASVRPLSQHQLRPPHATWIGMHTASAKLIHSPIPFTNASSFSAMVSWPQIMIPLKEDTSSSTSISSSFSSSSLFSYIARALSPTEFNIPTLFAAFFCFPASVTMTPWYPSGTFISFPFSFLPRKYASGFPSAFYELLEPSLSEDASTFSSLWSPIPWRSVYRSVMVNTARQKVWTTRRRSFICQGSDFEHCCSNILVDRYAAQERVRDCPVDAGM